MRRRLLPIAAVLIAAAVTAGIAIAAQQGDSNNKTFEYTVGLWGDLPYSDTQAQTGVPNLIATPHAGFYSEEAIAESQTRAAQAIVDVLSGREPRNRVV